MQKESNYARDNTETADQYLTFQLDDEEYGVEILNVQEIKSWGPYTPLPKSPEHVLGIINLRGAIVPIVDLRRRFKLPPAPYTATTAIIIVRCEHEGQTRIIGLVVDRVADVYQLAPDGIQDATEINDSSMPTGFVRGFGQIDDKMLILINLDPIVSSTIEPDQILSDT